MFSGLSSRNRGKAIRRKRTGISDGCWKSQQSEPAKGFVGFVGIRIRADEAFGGLARLVLLAEFLLHEDELPQRLAQRGKIVDLAVFLGALGGVDAGVRVARDHLLELLGGFFEASLLDEARRKAATGATLEKGQSLRLFDGAAEAGLGTFPIAFLEQKPTRHERRL